MSQYAATTPVVLSWFEDYNRDKAYAYQVRPFNFMVYLQLASDLALAAPDPDILADRRKANAPRPAAPSSRDPAQAAANAFDRKRGGRVDPASLKPLARSLARYHLHPGTKFLGEEENAVGELQRRHVGVFGIHAIGKQADALEERQFLGEGEAAITYPLAETEIAELFVRIWSHQAQLEVSDRDLTGRARISHHTLLKLRDAGGSVADATRLIQAIEAYRQDRKEEEAAKGGLLQIAQTLAAEFGGAAALGSEIGLSRQYVGRIFGLNALCPTGSREASVAYWPRGGSNCRALERPESMGKS